MPSGRGSGFLRRDRGGLRRSGGGRRADGGGCRMRRERLGHIRSPRVRSGERLAFTGSRVDALGGSGLGGGGAGCLFAVETNTTKYAAFKYCFVNVKQIVYLLDMWSTKSVLQGLPYLVRLWSLSSPLAAAVATEDELP